MNFCAQAVDTLKWISGQLQSLLLNMQHRYSITAFSLFCNPLNHFFPKQGLGVAFLVVLFSF